MMTFIMFEMPTINRNPIKPKRVNNICGSAFDCSQFYSSPAWQRLRNTFITEHPVCECCLEHKRVTPAEHVHHRRPFKYGKNEEEQWSLFLNQNNLVALCECCHYAIHGKMIKYNLEQCDSLTDVEWRDAHGMQ